MKKQVCLLGATGSIGASTLDVIRRNSGEYQVFALAANTNVAAMETLCREHLPKFAVMACEDAASALKLALSDTSVRVLAGVDGMCEVSAHDEVDILVAAIVGAAGVKPTLAGVNAGKRILLANKEALVMTGRFFTQAVADSGAQLLPVDSEHNAIFQCLPQNKLGLSGGVSKILLTGSGGPFRERELERFSQITPAEAVNHPNWSMGQKISVDSATMMNKGLEFIEAKWLFDVKESDIEVVLHPQSIIHSMVQYKDGSVLAQMGNPDMRTPIAHALAYPKRIDAGVEALDFASIADFTFSRPDPERYPNLYLAIEACKLGQEATTLVNAANEVSVAAFLSNKIKFTDIYKVNAQVLEQSSATAVHSLEDIYQLDATARVMANEAIRKLN